MLKKVLKNSDFRVFPETVKKWGTRFRHILGLGRVLIFGLFWGHFEDPQNGPFWATPIFLLDLRPDFPF